MRFLLFDVRPAEHAHQQYLDIAASLRPALDAQGGCLFIDRFRAMDDPGWLLSFQIWRDEDAVVAWRGDAKHHAAQTMGRERVFDDYRIRVGDVVAERSPKERVDRIKEAPAQGRYVVLVEASAPISSTGMGFEGVKRFASIYREGEYLHVVGAQTLVGAEQAAQAMSKALDAPRARVCLVDRDYGMYERAEAPQTFPDRTRA